MPVLTLNGARCFYRIDGRDDRPVLVLAHSLGVDHTMWDVQADALAPHLRVLRYDIRGHGAASAPPGDYAIESLAEDVIALVDALGIGTFAFGGLSLGGMIGQRLAYRHGHRLTHLIVANTSPRVGDPDAMEARRKVVLADGMPAVVDLVLGRCFSPAWRTSNPPALAGVRRILAATDPVGYAGCCAAIRDFDARASLAAIDVPTLVIGGDRDVSMPWPGHGAVLASSIPGAVAVRLPAAHLSNLERPRSFTAALAGFLIRAEDRDIAVEGTAMRRAVLGDAHVDRSLASATELTRDFQQLITRYAWGTIWTRPGLDVRTRRLLVLATTAALGRWEEFRLHLEAGLAHELEWCDVEDVLLQTAVYAGVPAANTAFHIASDVRAASMAAADPTAS
jgi:3-oxoadipate enol-lactonase/4-carboxymuconolactone decarboxylase